MKACLERVLHRATWCHQRVSVFRAIMISRRRPFVFPTISFFPSPVRLVSARLNIRPNANETNTVLVRWKGFDGCRSKEPFTREPIDRIKASFKLKLVRGTRLELIKASSHRPNPPFSVPKSSANKKTNSNRLKKATLTTNGSQRERKGYSDKMSPGWGGREVAWRSYRSDSGTSKTFFLHVILDWVLKASRLLLPSYSLGITLTKPRNKVRNFSSPLFLSSATAWSPSNFSWIFSFISWSSSLCQYDIVPSSDYFSSLISFS